MHYGQTYRTQHDQRLENIAKDKWEFWKTCVQAKSVARQILSASEATIKRRDHRKKVAGIKLQPAIQTVRKHRPTQIEEDIHNALLTWYPDKTGHVIVVDFEGSKDANALDVYVELLSVEDILPHASRVISRVLERKHQCGYSHIYCYKRGSFDKFMQDGNKVSRFTLRDAVLLDQLKDDVISMSKSSQDDLVTIELDDDEDLGIICASCFTEVNTEPLDVESFNIFKEWCTDVPLQMQLIMESFVNDCSLKRAGDKVQFLRQKLQFLYGSYDTMLHCLNKKYFGVLQIANADELMMGYKSIQTVFEVTSGAGASTSLPVAERRLKLRVNKDDLYYAAYLKAYTMTYDTYGAENVTKDVRMRDCFIILMMDNILSG
jgi:transposase